MEAEQILQALGREPDLEGLNLWTAGVKTDKGKVTIQTTQQTSAALQKLVFDLAKLGRGGYP